MCHEKIHRAEGRKIFICYKCSEKIIGKKSHIEHISSEYHYNKFYEINENENNNIVIDDTINMDNLKIIPKDLLNLILTFIPSNFEENNIEHKKIVYEKSKLGKLY